jgi:hypothetical protein
MKVRVCCGAAARGTRRARVNSWPPAFAGPRGTVTDVNASEPSVAPPHAGLASRSARLRDSLPYIESTQTPASRGPLSTSNPAETCKPSPVWGLAPGSDADVLAAGRLTR